MTRADVRTRGRAGWRRVGVLPKALAVPLALAAIATASAPSLISIKSGDTVTSIAAANRTTVATLIALNHLPGDGNVIYAGQQLLVPTQSAAAAPASTRTIDTPYRVARGDSLLGIAARFHVDPDAIAARNALPASRVIQLDSTLMVPVPVTVAAPRSAYPPAVLAAAARDRSLLAKRSLPSNQHVRDLIVRTARAAKVDPALALAVAYQESGFQQRVVSDADAIGAMQVLPSTAGWLASTVLHRPIDLFKAEDNVLAGVTLLQQLLAAAPPDQAVAGYYQGLGSVQSRGMLPDTQAYVASVLTLRSRFA